MMRQVADNIMFFAISPPEKKHTHIRTHDRHYLDIFLCFSQNLNVKILEKGEQRNKGRTLSW